MRTFLAILFLSVPSLADVGVIVMKNGIVIGKEVYAGDTSGLAEQIAKRSQSDITLSFQGFDLKNATQATTFNAAVVPLDLNALPTIEDRVSALETATQKIATKTGTIITLQAEPLTP